MKSGRTAFVAAAALCSLFLTNSANAADDGRFLVVGKAATPNPTQAAQRIGEFAERVSPGSSMLAAGAVIALAFQMPQIDFSSPINATVYLDKNAVSGDEPIALAVAASPSGGKAVSKVRFGKSVFPAKSIDGKLLATESKRLLEETALLPTPLKSNSTLAAEFFPSAFLANSKGGLGAFAAYLAKIVLGKKTAPKFDNNRFDSLEKILSQTSSVLVEADADTAKMLVSISATPKSGTPLAMALAMKKGDMSEAELVALGKKLSGDKTLDVNKEITDVVAFLLKQSAKIQNNDFAFFAKLAKDLCDVKTSSDGKKLHIAISASPERFKKTLDIIRPHSTDKKTKRQRISF